MITTDYFNQPRNNVLAEDNLQIVLQLWKEGKFQSDLQRILNLDNPNSINLLTEKLNELGFLEIDKNKKNLTTSNIEPYYYINDENLRAILMHICDFANIPYNENVLEVIKKDRQNFNQELLNNIQNEFIRNHELKDRILKILMKKMISFFYLFIIEHGSTFKRDKECCEFSNDIMLETLLTNTQQVDNQITDKDNQTAEATAKIFSEKSNKDKVKEHLEKEKEIIRPWAKGV